VKRTLAAFIPVSTLGAFSFGVLAPTAEAITPIGTASPISISVDPNIELAATKVIKKRHKTVVTKNRHKTVIVKNNRRKTVVMMNKRHRMAWAYSRGKYGLRFKHRRPGYMYYYGGWWYPRPWWTICIGC